MVLRSVVLVVVSFVAVLHNFDNKKKLLANKILQWVLYLNCDKRKVRVSLAQCAYECNNKCT